MWANGVFLYSSKYRMQPSDQTSDLGEICARRNNIIIGLSFHERQKDYLDFRLRPFPHRTTFARSIHQRFRANVIECADLWILDNTGGVHRHFTGNPEVDQFQTIANDEEIFRFQIGMDDIFFVDVIDALEHLVPETH